MRRALGSVAAAAAVLLLTIAGVAAQIGATAQMTGTVRDDSGGVLPGADVTAIQTDTGVRRSAVTDSGGSYTLQNLPVGPYRLEVALTGFRSYAQTGIVLQVNANPVINVTLPIGDLSETVSVEAAAPLVETRSPSIGSMIENERIEELPLNGRNAVELITLAGAAVNQGTATSRSMQGGQAISVAGGQSFGVAYMLDGAMHNNPYDNLNLPLPFPDALQEFRVETSTTNANNGMHSGASVNAVTKSGTNLFHGDLFEFARNHRFNATNPFALRDASGERRSDGLSRNQFGGTLGGPIRTDRVFFFGAFQGSRTDETPADLFAFVPTPAMLAGDFSAIASAACNATGAVTLRAPFVNNRVDPALFSPAALNLVKELPATTDPCGRVNYSRPSKANEDQYIGKVDVQVGQNHSLFGRYMATQVFVPPPLSLNDNILVSNVGGRDNLAQSVTFGDTLVLSNATVNAVRVTFNRTAIHRTHHPLPVSAPKLGVKAYSYLDDNLLLNVNNPGFSIGGGTESEARFTTDAYQVGDDLTIVRGAHQFGFGGSLAFWKSLSLANVRSPGVYGFDGTVTGLGLGDFLLGRLASLIQAAPNTLDMQQWYAGLYAQDTWKLSPRATFNYGVRWEPHLPQQIVNGAVYSFSEERYLAGERTTMFKNAPPGFLYPGEPGFVNGKAGVEKKWLQFAPRVAFAWDPAGDGRMSVRSGYALGYDFINAQFHLNTSVAPPWGAETRLNFPSGGFDDPFLNSGQANPFPARFDADAPFPLNGPYLDLPSDLDTQRQQSWNVSVQRQIGDNMAVSASYIGTYMDHGWYSYSINPGVFLGTGPCTLQTASGPRAFPVCSTNANLDDRRLLRLQDYQKGRFLGAFDRYTDISTQRYDGLLLQVQRRAANGASVNANYTLSKCEGHPNSGGTNQNVNFGFVKGLEDPDYDYGACSSDRRHILNLTASVQTPEFGNRALRLVGSDWRLSGIFRAASGSPFTVTVTGDPARTGIAGQRANQVLDDPYGAKTLENYLNPAAFAQPAVGTYGNQVRNGITGPGSRVVDLALVRAFRFAETHRLEARMEAFNAFNWFRWNNPQSNLNNTQFGRITSAGDPRVMQFALKYSF